MVIKLHCFLIILSLVCYAPIIAQISAQSEGIFPYDYHEKILDNGFKVIVIPMESPGLVAYYSIVRTGSRDEYEPGHSGFAHFFEHMMFRGTEKYPGSVYDEIITEMGADANAYTSNDITCYHLNFASDDIGKVMDLESDRFQNLLYAEQAFKTEAGAVHGEYLKSLSNPWFALYEKLMDTAFDRHTYKHTTIGFKEDIEAMPTMYEFSKSFFNRYYRPENVVLLIVGDINPASTFNMVEKYFSKWERGYIPPEIPEEPEQKGERRGNVSFTGKSLPILVVAYKALGFDPDNIEMSACYLMGDLIFGETSDIYKKLVLDEQLVQSIEADFSSSRDPNLMAIFTMIKKEKDIRTVEEEIYKAIKSFQKNPVDEQKLNDLKSHLKYKFLMGLDTPKNVSDKIARTIAVTGGIQAVNRLYAGFDRVTAEDILRAANKYLIEDKRTVILLKGR